MEQETIALHTRPQPMVLMQCEKRASPYCTPCRAITSQLQHTSPLSSDLSAYWLEPMAPNVVIAVVVSCAGSRSRRLSQKVVVEKSYAFYLIFSETLI
eukprot:1992889-Pleurochrysis_carterae.AAC.1